MKSLKITSQMNAILLDRDGVIIRKAPEGEYVTRWHDVEFLPGALDAIQLFHRNGYKLIVVTNQRGVATGKVDIENMHEIHKNIGAAVVRNGGFISAVYYCPHDYSDQCDCRKPKPGMLLRAAADHDLVLPNCWMIGDSPTDVAAGKSVGCKTALIASSVQPRLSGESLEPDLIGDSLVLVATQIIESRVGAA